MNFVTIKYVASNYVTPNFVNIQPVYTQRTLSHGSFYPLFSGCWWSGSPTNTMFMLDVR